MERFTVFISSTSMDLIAERRAVADVLRKSDLSVTAMEDWDAMPSDATTVSLDGISRCDIFVGIYASRYGFIPPGSSTSITEQEYELARREGKRCLCYFKNAVDDDLLEPQSKRELLTAFKERIEKELVRGEFTSPEDLATKLALDISRLKQGYLPGYSHSDFLRRWSNRGLEMRNQLVQSALSGHTNLLPSPALHCWTRFISEISWHESIQRDLHSITEHARDIPQLSDLSQRASDLAVRISTKGESERSFKYQTILAELGNTVTEQDVVKTQEAIRQFRRIVDTAEKQGVTADPDVQERLYYARGLLRELRNIRESLKRPSFRKCFPVIGSLGSGRTHFIASLLGSTPGDSPKDQGNAAWCENHNFLVLLLNQVSTEPLEKTILERIRLASGLQWRTLEEVDSFLRQGSTPNLVRTQIRLCIAIDDLQRWLHNRNKFSNAIDELTQFIETHTDLTSLFWLFTLQDTSFSQVQALHALLKNYSYFQTEIEPELDRESRWQQSKEKVVNHVAGWLALDDLNREQEFGLRLIKKELADQGASLSTLDLVREKQAVLRNLIKPFVACVLIDLHYAKKINLESLATLSYMSFVTEFWEKRKHEFIIEYNRIRSGDSQDLGYDDWSQALKLVADTLCQTGEFNPLQKDLQSSVVEAGRKEGHPSPEQMAAAALNALTKSGFLKRFDAPDPQMQGYEVKKIGFEFEPFWQLRLADHISVWRSFKELDETAAKDELIKWFVRVKAGDLEEGILEFLLLLLDREADKNLRHRSFLSFLQQAAIDSAELPEEAVWFSGVNATLNAQLRLMELVGRGKNEFQDHRLLHSIMYFLVEALPEVSEAGERFRILQPHYDDINRQALSVYFLYVARRLLVQANDNDAVLRSMRYLSRSEVMGIAPALATLTVNVLFRKAEEHFGELNDACLTSLIEMILDYLKASSKQAEEEYDLRGPIKHWERFFYREWVLRSFCVRLVSEKGIDAYDMLAESQWYHPRKLNIFWPTSVEMDREANLALGDWYRMRRWGQKAGLYINLVQDLVRSSDFRNRATAFFLIRHSEPTHGQKGLPVDDIFVPMLKKIFLDPKLAKIVSRFYETFRINLPDFRNLENVRKAKLAKAGIPTGPPRRKRKF